MPIYEYKCSCGQTFDTVQSMSEPKLKKCNNNVFKCESGGELTRLISKPTIISDDIGRGTKKMSDEKIRKELNTDELGI